MVIIFCIIIVLLIVSLLLLKYSSYNDNGYVYEESKFLKEYYKNKVFKKEVLVEEEILY
jgi:hypothetical protein